jgi:hypothetical protein
MALATQNTLLQKQLDFRASHGLSLRIAGIVTTEVDSNSTRIQVTVIASNDGEPTTASNWRLIIRTNEKDFKSVYAFGEQLARGSLDLPRLDVRLQEPINKGVQIPGLIAFVFRQVRQKQIDDLRFDKSAELILSVSDNNGKEISTRRNIAEMAAEKLVRIPSK